MPLKEPLRLEVVLRLRDTAIRTSPESGRSTKTIVGSMPTMSQLHKIVMMQIWHDRNPLQENKLALLPMHHTLLPMHHTLLPSLKSHPMGSLATVGIKVPRSLCRPYQYPREMATNRGGRKPCLNQPAFSIGRDRYLEVSMDHETLRMS